MYFICPIRAHGLRTRLGPVPWGGVPPNWMNERHECRGTRADAAGVSSAEGHQRQQGRLFSRFVHEPSKERLPVLLPLLLEKRRLQEAHLRESFLAGGTRPSGGHDTARPSRARTSAAGRECEADAADTAA